MGWIAEVGERVEVECPACGRWIVWVQQDVDEDLAYCPYCGADTCADAVEIEVEIEVEVQVEP